MDLWTDKFNQSKLSLLGPGICMTSYSVLQGQKEGCGFCLGDNFDMGDTTRWGRAKT